MPEQETQIFNFETARKKIASYERLRGNGPLIMTPEFYPRTWALNRKTVSITSVNVRGRVFPKVFRDRQWKGDKKDDRNKIRALAKSVDLSHRHKHDIRRIPKNDPRRYLLGPLEGGPLLLAVRGKEIIYAVGRFALRVHYATEGHPVWMDTKRWRRIMAQDCAGVADTIYRAERMRSFVIPADLVPAGSIMWRRIFNYGTQEGPIVSEAPLAPLVGELELEDEEDEVREGDEPELDAEPPALGEAPGDETEYEAEWEDEDDAGTLDGGDEDEGTEADVEPRDVQFSPAPEEEYQPQPANLYGPDTQSEGASGLSEAESETEYEVLDSMRPRRTEDALPDDDASAESEEHEEHDDSIVLLPSDDEHAPRGPPRPTLLPKTKKGPATSSDQPPTMNAVAALVGEDLTMVLLDFNRLMHIDVLVLDRPWTAADLKSKSICWPVTWDKNHGPDWTIPGEKEQAEANLRNLRKQFLQELEQDATKNSSASSSTKKPRPTPKMKAQPRPPTARQQLQKPISDFLRRQDLFNGVGAKILSDILFLLGAPPHLKASRIFVEDELFERLVSVISRRLNEFQSDKYKTEVCTSPNTTDPFVFNKTSDKNYKSAWLLVYRKAYANMDSELWHYYARRGYFDWAHTWGEPYPEEKYKEYAKGVTIKKFKRVAVVQYRVPDQKWRSYGVVYASLKSEDSAKAGTVRMNFCGHGWVSVEQEGAKSTLGGASFNLTEISQLDPNTDEFKDGGRIAKAPIAIPGGGAPAKARSSKAERKSHAVRAKNPFWVGLVEAEEARRNELLSGTKKRTRTRSVDKSEEKASSQEDFHDARPEEKSDFRPRKRPVRAATLRRSPAPQGPDSSANEDVFGGSSDDKMSSEEDIRASSAADSAPYVDEDHPMSESESEQEHPRRRHR